MNKDSLKQLVAKHALEFLDEDIIIGVGSGSTISFFIRFLAEQKIKNILCIPTSYDTELLLRKYGLRIASMRDIDTIDLAVDGADAVFLQKRLLIKGGGGALLREKIVDYHAKELIILVDYSKIDRTFPVPAEILPFAYSEILLSKIKKEFGAPSLRYGKGKVGPIITDNGNWIIDIEVPIYRLNPELEHQINSIPGILENGIFTRNATILIATKEGRIEEKKI